MSSKNLDLSGKCAVLTGASGGIGEAFAVALAERGVHLLLAGRSSQWLEEVASKARAHGTEVQTLASDLSEEGSVEVLAHQALATFEGVDLLIHCIGLFIGGTMAESSMDDFDRQFRVNVRSPYQLTQALLPSIEERQGQIVFINSSAGQLQGRKGFGVYGATKHALRTLADSLRDEVNERGVRVLTVFPGRTASRMQAEVHRYEKRPYDPGRYMQPDDVAQAMIAALTLPRTAEVTDLQMRPLRG